MSGGLAASSVVGQGSVFTLTLPRIPDLVHVSDSSLTPAALVATPDALANGISVLYVEDNPANIEVVTRFLRGKPGTSLRSEASGRAGLESAARDKPDMILLDLHLPDMHGDRVLSDLKAEPATAAIPVVVLSADASPGVVRRLLASGASAYLTKPIELAELGKLLDTIAAAQEQDQESRQPSGSRQHERPGRGWSPEGSSRRLRRETW